MFNLFGSKEKPDLKVMKTFDVEFQVRILLVVYYRNPEFNLKLEFKPEDYYSNASSLDNYFPLKTTFKAFGKLGDNVLEGTTGIIVEATDEKEAIKKAKTALNMAKCWYASFGDENKNIHASLNNVEFSLNYVKERK
jgi:hypothetical protein